MAVKVLVEWSGTADDQLQAQAITLWARNAVPVGLAIPSVTFEIRHVEACEI
jgi:hypothetical protein